MDVIYAHILAFSKPLMDLAGQVKCPKTYPKMQK